VHLADVVQRNRDRYNSLQRKPKTNMIQAIANYIQKEKGGRFLKRAAVAVSEDGDSEENDCDELPMAAMENLWTVATDAEARLKISRSFRGPER